MIHSSAQRPGGGRIRLRTAVAAAAAVALLAGGPVGCTRQPQPLTEGAAIPEVEPQLWPAADGRTARAREGCDVLAGPAREGGVFIVALTDEVVPDHAPIPHNASERIVFGNLYETLVRVDCAGELQPGLAERWVCSPDSTDWVFTLREDAVFWDGTRVTAADVRQAWQIRQRERFDAAATAGHVDDSFSPWNWLHSQSRSVTVLDARRLAVRLPEPQARFPWLLAHPATAVTIERPGWTWPVGSGPCRLRASDPAPLPDLVCRPNTHHPEAPIWKSLTFRVEPGADPRDLVGAAPDLLLTRDLAVVRFYQEVPGYTPHALPWDRLYLLVCPPEANPDGIGRWSAAAGKLDVPQDLTGVATRSWDSVAFPAGGLGECPQLSGPVTDENLARLDWQLEDKRLDGDTLIFPAGDKGALELAHRLGALAGEPVRTVELPAPELAFALQWQMSGACIVAQPQHFPTSCLQLAALLGRAAWLQQLALGPAPAHATDTLGQVSRLPAVRPDPMGRLAEGGWVRPLALTRPWLIARGGPAGLRLDYDGMPRLQGLGQGEGGPQP